MARTHSNLDSLAQDQDVDALYIAPPDALYHAAVLTLARGGKYQVMEGTDRFHRFVVIEFPTLEQAVKCHQSPEYQTAVRFRRASSSGSV